MSTTSKTSKLELTVAEERLVRAMQILGDQTRFKIFKLIMDNSDLCVSDMAQKLNITLSAVSQHLRHFQMAGLVDKQRTGQKICYVLKNDDELVHELVALTMKKIKKGRTN